MSTGKGQSRRRKILRFDAALERMRSRLHEMCRIIKLDGLDFRQKFRSANFR